MNSPPLIDLIFHKELTVPRFLISCGIWAFGIALVFEDMVEEIEPMLE